MNNLIYILAKNDVFSVRVYKIFAYLRSSAEFRSIEFMFDFASFSHTKRCVVSYSCSLNKLNALGACHKLEPIDSAQNLSSGFI